MLSNTMLMSIKLFYGNHSGRVSESTSMAVYMFDFFLTSAYMRGNLDMMKFFFCIVSIAKN